jgi:hypothetical protein
MATAKALITLSRCSFGLPTSMANTASSTANAQKIAKLQKKIADLSSDCPTNVKDPTFSRWGTISAVAKVVLKHWIPLLFMAKNICAVDKYKEKNKYQHCGYKTG